MAGRVYATGPIGGLHDVGSAPRVESLRATGRRAKELPNNRSPASAQIRENPIAPEFARDPRTRPLRVRYLRLLPFSANSNLGGPPSWKKMDSTKGTAAVTAVEWVYKLGRRTGTWRRSGRSARSR